MLIRCDCCTSSCRTQLQYSTVWCRIVINTQEVVGSLGAVAVVVAAGRVEKAVAGAVAVWGEDLRAAANRKTTTVQRAEAVSAPAVVAFVHRREEGDGIP